MKRGGKIRPIVDGNQACHDRYARQMLIGTSHRRGLTLIELLISIAIIATLSAAFLGATRTAMESASASRTKSTISKINGLLMERWESYTTRRVEIKPEILQMIAQEPELQGRMRGLALADVRLLAIRELMKLEMPDRWSDVAGNFVDQSILDSPDYPRVLEKRPALAESYLRIFRQLVRQLDLSKQEDIDKALRYQGAECLYMTIILATGDGEARTHFNPQEIGDTDGDGAPEFLDGWGRPIHFIRWPAGFISDLQPLNSTTNSRPIDEDHDPYDYYMRNTINSQPNDRRYFSFFDSVGLEDDITQLRNPFSGYRLVPLIYSSGSSGVSDLVGDIGRIIGLNPYESTFGQNGNLQLATPYDREDDGMNWQDNIHNHLIDN